MTLRVLARTVEQKLFGTSGIRGVVNTDFTPALAVNVGQALATYTNSGRILVGRDTRISSPLLEHSLISGLIAGGSTVYRMGLTPTPVLAFVTKEIKANAGVMITASHNPPEYNGIKLFNADSMAYDEKEQNQIENLIASKSLKRTLWRNVGKATSLDESHRYTEAVRKTVNLEKQWRIILDPGCGATCQIAPTLFRMIGCKVTTINAQPDGFFPGRSPAPEAKSLQPLCGVVKQLNADLGIAYDGDGDRMVAVDGNGTVVPLDQNLAAYASHLTKKHKGGVVVTTIEASMCFEKMVELHDGKVARTKVGDVNVAAAIKQHKAIFGGEPCGAWIHPQHHFCPDGVLSSVLLLRTLEEEGKTLSSFVSEVPQYHVVRGNLRCSNEIKSTVMERIEEILPSLFQEIQEKLTIDGVCLALKNGRILVRPSGTEPLIRLTAEAESVKEAEGIMQKCVKLTRRTIRETT
ncbi:MAG: phosphoglucosamine mutase [Candidatus Bathyarchaeota archaeon]|nr:MAG: phosphoglucosamine mutase [Candidatus Bathyarchaeota archaeon]